MPRNLVGLMAFGMACSTIPCVANAAVRSAAHSSPLTKKERAEYVLDRLTFGPRSEDLKQVQAMGLERWIDQQLHPEKIDNAKLESRLAAFPAMQMSTEELMRRYPTNPIIRQLEAGKIGVPDDPIEHAVYASELASYRQQREKNAQRAQMANEGKVASSEQQSVRRDMAADSRDTVDVASLLRQPVAERWSALLAMQPGVARPLLQHMKPAERQQLVEGMSAAQKETLQALVQVNRMVTDELLEERLLRAIYSDRQLEEVMTDFWLNHFNIYLRKNGEEPWYLVAYERDVIRPHALGKFEDLLEAVAHSPAMLIYLDNQQSTGPHSATSMRIEKNPRRKNAIPGLNENYARELMELHTLGVNGGYTQKDVTEVAKVLTGWGVETPKEGEEFAFDEPRHEPGPKTVLGHTIRENGEGEGAEVLHILATNPATAHFLATQLAMRFVSDTPPQKLVDRMAKTYRKTHGDIRQVLRTMLHSPEFWSREAYRTKLKTPEEFLVSSLRATNADVEDAAALVASLNRLGMPLYGVQQPNGYSLKADPWLGAQALLGRMNFALALTGNKIPGVKVDLAQDAMSDSSQTEKQMEEALLDGRVAAHTHDAVLQQMEQVEMKPVQHAAAVNQTTFAAALLLGSPDFQRR